MANGCNRVKRYLSYFGIFFEENVLRRMRALQQGFAAPGPVFEPTMGIEV
jgi:hypothetical protein